MWIIPDSHAASASQKLSRAAWASLAMAPPTYQVLEPTPSDPILGSTPVGTNGPANDVVRAINDYKDSGCLKD